MSPFVLALSPIDPKRVIGKTRLALKVGRKRFRSGMDLLPAVQSRGEANRLNRLRGEFLTVASHELKTPITALKLQIQLVQRLVKRSEDSGPSENGDVQRIQNMLQAAEQQVSRLSDLAENILFASALQSGELKFRPERQDLSEILAHAMDRVRQHPLFKDYPFEMQVASGCVSEVDPVMVEQAMVNFLMNAATFGRGLPILVRLEVGSASSPKGGRPEKVVHFEVEDQGIGVAKRDLEKVFDLFERGVPLTQYGGLGLGLYIARRVAELHGGFVDARSKLGVGSAFSMNLPLYQKSQVPTPDHP